MTRNAWSVVLAALAAFGLAMSAAADAGGNAYKFAGVWVAKVPGSTAQWNYVVTADPSGRRASAIGHIDVGLYLGPDFVADETSPLLVEIVMTGPYTAKFNSVWYLMRRLEEPTGTPPVPSAVIAIGTSKGTINLLGPGKAEVFHNFAFYLPDADADQDGFPDPDAEAIPGTEFPAYTVDTRMPAP